MTPSQTATPSRRRRNALPRRILGSSLLNSLTTPHGVDRYLEILKPSYSLSDARAEVLAVERRSADTVTLTARPNRSFTGFKAGQFVRVGVEINGVRETRCYSPASAEGTADRVELTVKAHPAGKVSNFLVERAQPGMFLELSAADGDFRLPEARPEKVLLISGGSGITPVLSMLRTLVSESHAGSIVFLHYTRGSDQHPYRDELERIARQSPNVTIAVAYTREPADELSLEGRFGPSHLAALAPGHEEYQTFACGPESLLDAVRERWAEDGNEQRLHLESFTPPKLVSAGASGGTIRFSDSGIEVADSGATLLEQAEAAGLNPEHGCRMGICKTCTCSVKTGLVRDVRTGDVLEITDGQIQLCVSAPAGDVELAL